MGVHSEVFQIDVGVAQHAAAHRRRAFHPACRRLERRARAPGKMVHAARRAEPGSATSGRCRLTADRRSLTRVTASLRSRSSATSRCRGRKKSTWKSPDGATIEGLLFYPIDYQPGTRYPLVVQMHGGPMESDKFGAGAGAAAELFPGAGRARATPCSGRTTAAAPATATPSIATSSAAISSNMHLDVLAGVDALVQRGIADPDRLVAHGVERRRAPDQQARSR